MNNGFGFSFPPRGDDDDNGEGAGNNNPFGGGFNFQFGGGTGLGDMLSQFGQMLSGMGDSMNSPEAAGPVNYSLAAKIAGQHMGTDRIINPSDTESVTEAVRLAQLWLGDATDLPEPSAKVEAWNANQWFEATLPQWKRLIDPVVSNLNNANQANVPDEAKDMMGQMAGMMNSMNSMSQGMQVGQALGELAKQALSGADFGLPVSPAGTLALLPHNIRAISRDLTVPAQEVLVYLAAREAARQRLFHNVPWLVERIVSSVEEYAVGLEIDTSHIEEAMRELNLESGDPQALQDAMSRMQSMDLTPKVRSRNAGATSRLETLLALVEGWVDVVVYEALSERIPSTSALAGAWARRVSTGGSAEHAISKVVGIEIGAPQVAAAAELWRRVTNAVGASKRDAVWEHPDLLPSTEHLANPAAFIDGLLDDSNTDGFEEEFAKLEEMLRGTAAGESLPEEGATPDEGAEKNKPSDNPEGAKGPEDPEDSDS